jgi:hypothetical protein
MASATAGRGSADAWPASSSPVRCHFFTMCVERHQPHGTFARLVPWQVTFAWSGFPASADRLRLDE